jgi:hypothetical protein
LKRTTSNKSYWLKITSVKRQHLFICLFFIYLFGLRELSIFLRTLWYWKRTFSSVRPTSTQINLSTKTAMMHSTFFRVFCPKKPNNKFDILGNLSVKELWAKKKKRFPFFLVSIICEISRERMFLLPRKLFAPQVVQNKS